MSTARRQEVERPSCCLDEPANGLDPTGVVEIRDMLGDLAARHGTTILLSSHILAEVAHLATRIGTPHEGRLVREDHHLPADQPPPIDLSDRHCARVSVATT